MEGVCWRYLHFCLWKKQPSGDSGPFWCFEPVLREKLGPIHVKLSLAKDLAQLVANRAHEHTRSQEWVQSSFAPHLDFAWLQSFHLQVETSPLQEFYDLKPCAFFLMSTVFAGGSPGRNEISYFCYVCPVLFIWALITHPRTVPYRQKSGTGPGFNKKLTYFYEQNC